MLMALSPYRPHEYCQKIPRGAVPSLPQVNLQNCGEKVSINRFTIITQEVLRASWLIFMLNRRTGAGIYNDLLAIVCSDARVNKLPP